MRVIGGVICARPCALPRALIRCTNKAIASLWRLGRIPTLVSLGQRCVPDTPAAVVAALIARRTTIGRRCGDFGDVVRQRRAIDWAGFERDYAAAGQRVSLPTYPFERKSFWWKSEWVARAPRSASQRWAACVRRSAASPASATRSGFVYLRREVALSGRAVARLRGADACVISVYLRGPLNGTRSTSC